MRVLCSCNLLSLDTQMGAYAKLLHIRISWPLPSFEQATVHHLQTSVSCRSGEGITKTVIVTSVRLNQDFGELELLWAFHNTLRAEYFDA
mmetsp:Transcript_46702/g.108877  ORF Transcript_46702/g.108877 Transcript_46702/m.108877 type:complete len:90 (+) Transcript_46702:1-270(+)